MPLNQYELEKNLELVTAYVASYPLHDRALPPTVRAKIETLILSFAAEHDITLRNLKQGEIQQLIGIVRVASQNNRLSVHNPGTSAALLRWKAGLKDAVAHQGATAELYAKQPVSGIAAAIRIYGTVAPGTRGTDLDVKHILDEHFTEPRDITGPGTYVLPPIDISSPDLYTHQLQEVANTLSKKGISGEVKVLTALCTGSHWRTGIVSFHDGKLETAELWDPMHHRGNYKGFPAYQNMQNAMNRIAGTGKRVELEFKDAGVQRDDFRCMDYSVQKILQALGKTEHPMVEAGQNGEKLRAAVIKTIIDSQGLAATPLPPSPKLNELAQKATATDPSPAAEEQKEDIEKSVHEYLTRKDTKIPHIRERFDAIFAAQLQALYDDAKNKDLDESELVSQARREALRHYSLFSRTGQSKNPTHEASPDADFPKLDSPRTPRP